MALDIQRMMMQLQPARPLDFGGGESSAERARLKLAREQFEQAKKEHAEDKELRRLEEQGRNARAAMERQEALRKEEEQRKATLLAQQQAQLQKFGEAAGSGKVQAAQAMSPLMDQLGYDVNTLGSVGGLPVFQLMNRAQEAERAAAALPPPGMDETVEQSALRLQTGDIGYPTNERGNLDDPSARRAPTLTDETLSFEPGAEVDEATADALTPGDADLATAAEYGGDAEVSVGRGMVPASLSQGDAFAQALAASEAARANGGQPVRGPDEEDYMGAVPRNVIDLPAMQAETLARLNPALKARVEALPEELRAGALANAKAIGGLGLEAPDALKEMDTALEDPVSIYNQKLNIQAQKEKANQVSPMDVSTWRMRGAERLQKLADKRGANDVLKAVKSADVALSVLNDDTPANDYMIAPALMEAQGVKGMPSDTDARFALGSGNMSLLQRGQAWVEEKLRGGMSAPQREAIKKYLKSVQESQKGTVNDYLNSAYGVLDSGELNEHEARGYRGALEESLPAWMVNDYLDERDKRGGKRGAAGSAPAGAAGAELQRQAESAGLNGQVLGQLMAGESGGSTSAASDKSSAKGVFQLIDGTAQDMGYKDAAEYASEPLEKQIEVGLKLFKNKGLTADSPPEDYALVLAAPSLVGKWKSRDEVVYKKDSDQWKANAPWRPADGGDITIGSIADYYLAKGGKPAEAAPAKTEAKAATKLDLPEPKTPAEKRIVELLKKRGG